VTRVDALILLGLGVLAVAIFGQAANFGFVSFDDTDYFTRQPRVLEGLSLAGARWAFTTHAAANWHPLTWLCLMLEVTLFGTAPGPHHLVGVALHAANAGLVFLVLLAATGDRMRSALVAALFCAHPQHVESVAWIAERKDLLSALFGLLALWAWVRFTQRPAASRYSLTLLLFAASLLSKPTLVTFPFLLLVLDRWPLARGCRLLEKLPFAALSAGCAAMTLTAQTEGGAVQTIAALSLPLRIANAASAYAAYLGKTAVPTGLSYFYPFDPDLSAWQWAPAAAGLAALSVLAFSTRRTRPFLLAGWLWYLGMLVPMIGLIQVGSQARADRYTYLPLLGIFWAVAWLLPDRLPWRRALAGVCLTALAALSFRQAATWHDSFSLYLHALEVDPDNWNALANLGGELLEHGKASQAREVLTASLQIHPANPLAQAGLGLALERLGDRAGALRALEQAALLDPANEQIQRDLTRLR
jgi:tetratricopeptide (TPR) repeat protein